MSLRHACLAWAALAAALPAAAQTPHAEEMRFVHELRARRLNDLALEYLLRLDKAASPQFKGELTYEIAKTRLEAAGDEPDTAKRLTMLTEAQADLKKFL